MVDIMSRHGDFEECVIFFNLMQKIPLCVEVVAVVLARIACCESGTR